jgi:hypothetical protein
MIFSSKFIALLGTTCFSVVTAQQTGENCPVYTSVECYLGSPPSNGMPDGEACHKLKEEATCGIKQVYWKYKYCNSNSEGKTMKMWSDKTEVRYDQQKFNGIALDTSNFPAETCREPEPVIRSVDTCGVSAIASDIKVEGRLMEGSQVLPDQSDYCFGYAFKRIQLRQDLVSDPVEEYPSFEMDLECSYESQPGSGFTMNCDNLPAPSGGQCLREVEYKYTVTNKGGEAFLQAIIDEDNTNLIKGGSVTMKAASEQSPPKIFTKREYVDLCKKAGQTITAAGSAVATSAYGNKPATVSASIEVTLP